MPIGIKNLKTGEVTMPGKNKKYKGPLPKSKPPKDARPTHPMNTERTTIEYNAAGGKIKMSKYYSSGGKVYTGRD